MAEANQKKKGHIIEKHCGHRVEVKNRRHHDNGQLCTKSGNGY